MNGLNVELKAVSKFYVIQADRDEKLEGAIIDEKEFKDHKDALRLISQSEAPVKYLKFIHAENEYRLYPIVDSEDYDVVKTPIYN